MEGEKQEGDISDILSIQSYDEKCKENVSLTFPAFPVCMTALYLHSLSHYISKVFK